MARPLLRRSLERHLVTLLDAGRPARNISRILARVGQASKISPGTLAIYLINKQHRKKKGKGKFEDLREGRGNHNMGRCWAKVRGVYMNYGALPALHKIHSRTFFFETGFSAYYTTQVYGTTESPARNQNSAKVPLEAAELEFWHTSHIKHQLG